jgi:hypothetical protein
MLRAFTSSLGIVLLAGSFATAAPNPPTPAATGQPANAATAAKTPATHAHAKHHKKSAAHHKHHKTAAKH